MRVDLPPGTASWVLSAHALTILSPLVVVWSTLHYWNALQSATFMPALFLVAALVLIVGSCIESLQNARDNWYLTHNDPSFLDGAFNTCIVCNLALVILACQGQYFWLWPLSLGGVGLYAFMYAKRWPKEAVQGVLGAGSTLAMYLSFRDPVVIYPLLTVFLTLYFLGILLKTQAQSMHGFTTVINAVGLMATPWAMANLQHQSPRSWAEVLLVCAGVVIVALLVRPKLNQLSSTPHKEQYAS